MEAGNSHHARMRNRGTVNTNLGLQLWLVELWGHVTAKGDPVF